MFRVATTAFFTASLLAACSFSTGSKPTAAPADGESSSTPPADTKPAVEEEATTDDSGAPSRTNPAGEPSRTNPAGKPVRTNPENKPASYAEGMAALDPADPDVFDAAVALFVTFHPSEGTRASTLRLDLQTFISFVETTTPTAEATVRGSSGLMAAACQSAGFDCGSATEKDRAELKALHARGIRFAYGGEGTVTVAVDHAAVATALKATLDEPSTVFLEATHASALLSESFDEGSFTGKPSLAVDALTRWEQLVAAPGPYAAGAPKEAAAVRESYLRLCFDGEHQKPPCQASKALRASYARFAKTHADSPSAPAVALLSRSLRARGWKATAAQLDAMVGKALSAAK